MNKITKMLSKSICLSFLVTFASIALFLIAEGGASVYEKQFTNNRSEVKREYYESVVDLVGGSGVVINSEYNKSEGVYVNYILTCKHCVEHAKKNLVHVHSYGIRGESTGYFEYPYEVCVLGEKADFAIVKTKTPNQLLDRPHTTKLELGEKCIAVGYPLKREALWISEGIVSNIDMIPGNIGIDAAINPGNSGGMVVNEDHKLIGISCSVSGYNIGHFPSRADGIGHAVPIYEIFKELSDLQEDIYFD